jgi:predicted ATPase
MERSDFMKFGRDNFYVLSGGSGTGKSAIIEALRQRGFLCVDEPGRAIVQEQVRIGGDGTPWQARIKFRELLLSRSLYLFEQVREDSEPVFFDRGIPEGIGYCRFLKVPVPDHHRAAARIYRYASNVFVTPPWQEIFKSDDERKHTWAEAVEDYRVNVEAYTECGYQLLEVPRIPVAERVDFILEQVHSTR